MSRLIICHLLLLSILCMSVEAAVDMASDIHPNTESCSSLTNLFQSCAVDNDVAHAENVGQLSDSGSNNCCQHCCHTNLYGFASNGLTGIALASGLNYQAEQTPKVLVLSLAPPNPPPNA